MGGSKYTSVSTVLQPDPHLPIIQVLDTTGAGDAFCAGFLWHYVRYARNNDPMAIKEALRWGCIIGTTVVTKMGASTTPSLKEIHVATRATP